MDDMQQLKTENLHNILQYPLWSTISLRSSSISSAIDFHQTTRLSLTKSNTSTSSSLPKRGCLWKMASIMFSSSRFLTSFGAAGYTPISLGSEKPRDETKECPWLSGTSRTRSSPGIADSTWTCFLREKFCRNDSSFEYGEYHIDIDSYVMVTKRVNMQCFVVLCLLRPELFRALEGLI